MKSISMKFADEDMSVTVSMKKKDHPDQDDLEVIKECFVTLLKNADFDEEDINTIVKK